LGVATRIATTARAADALVLAVCGAAALGASFVWPRCQPAAAWLRRIGLIAFFAVVLQGILGGLRVVLFKDQIGIFHATLAQLFFVLMCALALFTSRWWQERFSASTQAGTGGAPGEAVRQVSRSLGWLCAAASALILFQLILGATMRHQHAGLAIPDFPTAYGKLWPATDAQSVARYNQQRLEVVAVNPITSLQIVLQMVHRLAAFCILLVVALCAWMSRRQLGPRHAAAKLTLAWFLMILLQAVLGAATIWSNKAADIATAHVLVGALSLGLGSIISIVLIALPERTLKLAAVLQTAEPAAHFGGRPTPAAGFE
jgi:cytochrome c oxidase assembly protein subunit 15